MRSLNGIVWALLVCAMGCQKPGPVVVEPPPDASTSQIDVTTLPPVDTNAAVTPVDSIGLLGADQTAYSGYLLVNSVKYDAGNGVHEVASSSVALFNRNMPLLVNGHVVGYWAVDPTALGPLTPFLFDGAPMIRIPYRLHNSLTARDTSFGFVFYRDISSSYQSGRFYRWSASAAVVGTLDDSIRTPADLQVQEPAGGAKLSRASGIDLRWNGKGDLNIIISVWIPLTGKTWPVMTLHPRVNVGSAFIGPQLLKVLAPRYRYFVFTFIIANKHERLVAGQVQGKILVQAASVHNSYVELD